MDTLRVLHRCSSSTATAAAAAAASNTSSQNHCPRQFKFLSHHQRHATLTFIRPSIFQTPGFADRSTALRRHSSPILCGVSSVQTREEEKMGKKKAQGKVRLSVRLDHQVQFGDHVAVLGSTKELGSWKKQVAMKWTEDGWVCAVELEGGDSVEYKFVIVRKNKKVVWESGDNRVLKLPKGGSFAIICHWDMTGEAVDLLPLDLEQNVEGVEYVGDNGSAATDVVVGTSSFVEQWQGKAASFMRSNEHHNREADRKWDTSGLEGLAVKLVEGDRNGRNWWRKAHLDKMTVRQNYRNLWHTDLMRTITADPAYCCFSALCAPCVSYMLRKRALYGDMSRYTCCGGYMPCSGRCGESQCPELCLCTEVFLCFANSVASTRFMLQDEFNIQTTQCDNCIIGFMFCLQQLACIFSIVACVTGMEELQEASQILSCLADMVYCTVCACMQTQHKVEMDKRDGKFGPQPAMAIPPVQHMSRIDQPFPPSVGYPPQQPYGYPPPPPQAQYPPAGYPPPAAAYPPPAAAYPPPAGYPR